MFFREPSVNCFSFFINILLLFTFSYNNTKEIKSGRFQQFSSYFIFLRPLWAIFIISSPSSSYYSTFTANWDIISSYLLAISSNFRVLHRYRLMDTLFFMILCLQMGQVLRRGCFRQSMQRWWELRHTIIGTLSV